MSFATLWSVARSDEVDGGRHEIETQVFVLGAGLSAVVMGAGAVAVAQQYTPPSRAR